MKPRISHQDSFGKAHTFEFDERQLAKVKVDNAWAFYHVGAPIELEALAVPCPVCGVNVPVRHVPASRDAREALTPPS